MKKNLLIGAFLLSFAFVNGQTTYYWVGGTANVTNGINTGANWNTALNGSGSSRPSSTGATDILVFDGTNLGGAVPATGPATILGSAGITCGQVIFTNNVNVTMLRPTSGTSTITISGGIGEDFVVEAGSSFSVNSPVGSLRFTFQSAVDACRVSGTVSLITAQQMRFDNGTAGSPGTFIFTSGSSFTTNITSVSSSYAFGSSSQSSEKWVIFQDGAQLYYEGGYSPMGSTSTFSAIDFKPGSVWHHKANNGLGSFFNRKSFGNIIVENNATLTADGPIYRINNLTINNGCSFIAHTSGQTGIMGNLVVNGSLTADPASTNDILFAGNTAQSISGTGSISFPNLIIADNAVVTQNSDVTVKNGVTVFGKLNFTNKQVTGAVSFSANGINTPVAGVGTTATGSYMIIAGSGVPGTAKGQRISGAGISPNTSIVAFSSANDTIYISQPLTATGNAVALSVSTSGATLQTANSNGFNPSSGSVVVSGTMSFQDNINYIIDGATSWPFGVTTGSPGNTINAGSVVVNANITVNKGVNINSGLLINGKMILRPADTVHILTGAAITGTFGSAKYIATDYVTATGVQSFVQYDGVAAVTTIPLGTIANYLPVTITPVSSLNLLTSVFQGITTNGNVNGTAFSAVQKQTVVDAVWQVNRLSGTGSAVLQLNWPAVLEGSTFATLPNLEIGLIRNLGSFWELPTGTGNNTTNIVTGTITNFGSYSAGAVPQVQPFVFNAIPAKTYGNLDFNGGATSLNTTQPIVYSSSNPAVATIVAGNIHITGAGTTVITATQATDGQYPNANVTQTLTVNKANLVIKADDKLRFEGLVNPTLTATYTSFVLGETPAVFITPLVINTTATIASLPGTYPITVSGATAPNYTISFVNGTLTVQAKQNQTITFAAPATKTYGNAPFATGATSTNSTIPVTYTSSSPSVATVTGNTITITGAGTTTITAMQAGNDGYFAAANVARTLTVNKANLTIRVTDTTKLAGTPNPAFAIVYMGFVLGETATNLTTQPTVITSAVTSSSPGLYALDPSGAVSSNYSITYISGRLTILPVTGTSSQYLNAFRTSSGNIGVRVYSPETHLADIMLYDLSGRPMMRRNILMPVGFAIVELPAQKLPSGMYIVSVIGEGVKLEKMIYFLR